MSCKIHPLSDVECRTDSIGDGTKIWRWTHVCLGVQIGRNCMIGANCYIGPSVIIGDCCRIQNGSFIPKGVELGNNVFVGPCVVFTNDKYPPSHILWKTKIEDGVSIGANSSIIPGIVIGRGAKIGAGSVVTKSVPAEETWAGNPARKVDYEVRNSSF